jgi:3-isopropylmalate dehydrogenase
MQDIINTGKVSSDAIPRLSNALPTPKNSAAIFPQQPSGRCLIGILPGEGVGPELTQVVRELLGIVARHWQLDIDIQTGGAIGTVAEKESGLALTEEVSEFAESIFEDQGVLLCGPGGGRFVYELRAHFDLFCKFTPVRPFTRLQDAGVLRPKAVDNVDMVIVRENVGGLYFGHGSLSDNEAIHTFHYDIEHVRRIIEVAVRLAQQRQGKLMLTVKTAAVKEVSLLWVKVFNELTAGLGLDANILEIDNANYQIIADAQRFDVVVTPNMFGDIISDVSALLLGSRGMSFSGNFSNSQAAVYQTAHGAAYDLEGNDTANPIGQILSAAMMLRESFALFEPAAAIEGAVEQTIAKGIRTLDIASKDSRIVGTQEMGSHIAETLEEICARSSSAT